MVHYTPLIGHVPGHMKLDKSIPNTCVIGKI